VKIVAENGHIWSAGNAKIHNRKTERHTLVISERKIMRITYGPVKENEWHVEDMHQSSVDQSV
jgi:hypothetical protein